MDYRKVFAPILVDFLRKYRYNNITKTISTICECGKGHETFSIIHYLSLFTDFLHNICIFCTYFDFRKRLLFSIIRGILQLDANLIVFLRSGFSTFYQFNALPTT